MRTTEEATSRRHFLTTAAGIAAGGTALALTVVPASAISVSSPQTDGDLRQALNDLLEMDAALAALHDKHGDDADSRDDYQEHEDMRDAAIATLIDVRASSTAGMMAKASALQIKVLFEDYEMHQLIGLSLADDLIAIVAQNRGMV